MEGVIPFTLALIAGAISAVALLGLFRVVRAIIPTRFRPSHDPKNDHLQILVLGDIGRSPRMQYHALSIAKHSCPVDLVGYKETARHPDLVSNHLVGLYPLSRVPEWLAWQSGGLVSLTPLVKAVWGTVTLFITLCYETPPARWIVIQNPPSIPTLHVALLVSWLRGSKLMVDWHNYGWSIMAISRSPRSPLVRMYKWYECFFGRHVPHANITVTDAMARQLAARPYSIQSPIYTMHDRPATNFQPIATADARRAAFSSMEVTRSFAKSIISGETRLVVSSTSWTPDEDFGLLLDALLEYAPQTNPESLPSATQGRLLVIITGKGPQKAHYESRIQELTAAGRLQNITILTAWLSNSDYATLLACADLGVCLHKSSSGVDLPMKIVDMFGAGLPVVAYSDYESFSELVKEGENGVGFRTATELGASFRRLLAPAGEAELRTLREGAIREGRRRWDDEWDGVIGTALGVVREK